MPTLWVWTPRVYAEMLDGPLAGKSAELHGLSEQRDKVFHPDPAFLRLKDEVRKGHAE